MKRGDDWQDHITKSATEAQLDTCEFTPAPRGNRVMDGSHGEVLMGLLGVGTNSCFRADHPELSESVEQ